MKLYNYLQQLPLSADGKGLIDLPPSEKEEAFQWVWEALIRGEFRERWEIAKFLPKFGDRAIAPLAELLEDSTADIDLRCEAAAILSEFQTPAAIFYLTSVLKTETELEVIDACAHGLSKQGKVAIPTLTEALNQPQTKLTAVEALAYLRQPETIEPLLTVVNDGDAEVRRIAIEALGSFRDSRIVEALISALQDTDSGVRKESVIALGVRGNDYKPHLVVEALSPLLSDINGEVASHCAIALGRLGTVKALYLLYNYLNSSLTPEPLKKSLIQGLSHQETSQSCFLLLQSLQQQPLPIVQEIITVVGRWKSEEHKPQIVKTLRTVYDQTPTWQQEITLKPALAVAMGNLGRVEGKDILQQLSQDKTPIVKLHAQAALKKLP
ncbi:MAG: HEAT repeat domain-containing protein [Halothece sp.]